MYKDIILKSDPLVYQNIQIEKIKNRWNFRAKNWDEYLKNPNFHLNIENAYIDFLLFAKECILEFYPKKINLLMDLCCGTGLVSEFFKDMVDFIIGIDISESMIFQARLKRISNASFVKGNCFRLPFVNSTFQAVISRGVILSHYPLKATLPLLINIQKVIKPNGLIIMDYLNSEGIYNFNHIPSNKTFYSYNLIKQILKKAGMKILKIKGKSNSRTHFFACRS